MLFVSAVHGAELFQEFPEHIEPDEHYVFYSHGLIVEGSETRPVHSEFGVYQFPEITESIFATGGFNLIAHHRPANTNPDQYSAQLVNWVQALLDKGVAAEKITLIGFSRGAQITLSAAYELRTSGINTVIMGVCFDGDYAPQNAPENGIQLGGHVLSIYETSDVVQSCSALLTRSTSARSTEELAITTGLEHGTFYTPRPEWLLPLQDWLRNLH